MRVKAHTVAITRYNPAVLSTQRDPIN